MIRIDPTGWCPTDDDLSPIVVTAQMMYDTLPEITDTGIYMDAPNSATPDQGNANLQAFLSGMTQFDMDSSLLEFATISVGLPSLVVGGLAVAPLLQGPALGAAMELGSSTITGSTELSEALEAYTQTTEQLGAELRSIELSNPEVAGPELPWSPR